MTSAFSWQNSVRLCHASFCTPRPNLPVTLGISFYFIFLVSLNFLLCIPVPYDERIFFFFLVVVLEGLVVLQRTIQLQLLQH